MTATLTNIAKSAASSLTGFAKDNVSAATGGEIFYGWMFLFTITTGTQIRTPLKHTSSLINVPKH